MAGGGDPASVPSLYPNTLRKVRLADLWLLPNMLLPLLQIHSNSLEEFTILRCTILSDGELVASAVKSITNLRRLESFGNNYPTELPGTVVHVGIDWPRCTPKEALEFIRNRSANAGPLRSLNIGYARTAGEWQTTKDVARSLGVEFLFSVPGPYIVSSPHPDSDSDSEASVSDDSGVF